MSGLRDPTRSQGLRRSARGLVNRRVYTLHRNLRRTLQEQDFAGLRGVPDEFMAFVETPGNRLERSGMMLQHIVASALATPPDWLRHLIERAVWKGVGQVGQELRVDVDALDPAEVAQFHSGSAAVEVRGIAGETERRLMRHMVRALEAGWTPDRLMREVRVSLEKITRARLYMLVNMAVVRAVNGGKLFAYAENGVHMVGVEPEWLPHLHARDSVVTDARSKKSKVRKRKQANKAKRQRKQKLTRELPSIVHVLTAGDDRVCETCENISANGPYPIAEAVNLIPNHPNCRCAFVPYGDERYAEIEEENE